MRRLLLRIGLSLGANALAFLVCAAFLDGFEINVTSFVFAVIVFGGLNLIVEPIAGLIAVRMLPATLGLVALLVNALTLWLTDLISDGIDISGVGTFVLAVIIIWVVNLILALVPGPWRRQRLGRRR